MGPNPPTLHDKKLDEIIKQLKADNMYYNERAKVLERRIDFTEDRLAQLAIEQQAFIKGSGVIMKIANELYKKYAKDHTKPAASLDQHIQ